MAGLTVITTNQFLIRLNQDPVDGVIDLSNIDFREVNLRQREVREKFIEVTKMAAKSTEPNPVLLDFTNSNISGRGFYEFDLKRAIMTGVTAERTVFAGSDLSDIQLDNANLNYADFRYTNLNYTKLHNTSIIGTNFSGADLSNTLGLKFRSSDKEIIERIGKAGNLHNTILPDNVEKIRKKIETAIEKNHPRTKPRPSSSGKDARAPSGAKKVASGGGDDW